MSVFDVRKEPEECVGILIFAEENSPDDEPQAYKVFHSQHKKFGSYIEIMDGEGDVIIINTREHAENLIKALNKAIDLGWLK